MEDGSEKQSYRRSRCCCTDIPFALLFVVNLVILVWIAVYAIANGDGFEGDFLLLGKIQTLINGTAGNSSLTVGGFNLQHQPLWQQFCEWLLAQFALMERDVLRNWDLLLGMLLGGMLLGIIWLQLLKRATSCIVHVTLLLVVVVITLLGFVLFHYSRGCLVSLGSLPTGTINCMNLHPLTELEAAILKWTAVGVWTIGAIILLAICFLRSKISLTVVIFEEACRGCLNNLGIYPVTFFVAMLVVAFHVFWFSTWMYLFSVPSDQVLGIPWMEESSTSVRGTMIYMLFGYWWTCAFLGALFHSCVSGIVGAWYFERKNVSVSASRTLFTMLTRCMGALATGSFLIGLLSMVRWAIKKLQRLTKKQPALSGILKCCGCCVCLVEKVVSVVNKYAYVYVAMEHATFCVAAKKSFGLIRKYPIQLVVMRAINGFVLLCGKLLLTTTCMLLLVLAMVELERDFCAVFVLVVALATFQVFRFQANIIAAAADTIFVCYAMDLDLNEGEAVHLKQATSNRLHEKVEQAVAGYMRDHPEEAIEMGKMAADMGAAQGGDGSGANVHAQAIKSDVDRLRELLPSSASSSSLAPASDEPAVHAAEPRP